MSVFKSGQGPWDESNTLLNGGTTAIWEGSKTSPEIKWAGNLSGESLNSSKPNCQNSVREGVSNTYPLRIEIQYDLPAVMSNAIICSGRQPSATILLESVPPDK